jgi:hypothetical protein
MSKMCQHIYMIKTFALILLLISSLCSAESIFDRLDGTGPSKKRVNVIEWEGNLEIHVYPKGSLNSLGAKLDEPKSVMVLSYSFKNGKKILIRRAIIGFPFYQGFTGFIDVNEKEFDKIILSNKDLFPLKVYQISTPKVLYPDDNDD